MTTSRLYRTPIDGLIFFAAKPVFEVVENFQNADAIRVALRLYGMPRGAARWEAGTMTRAGLVGAASFRT